MLGLTVVKVKPVKEPARPTGAVFRRSLSLGESASSKAKAKAKAKRSLAFVCFRARSFTLCPFRAVQQGWTRPPEPEWRGIKAGAGIEDAIASR